MLPHWIPALKQPLLLLCICLLYTSHEPFTSTQDAITKESDILSDSILVKRVTERKNVGATDTGAKLKERIAELKELLDAYRNGLLVEKL